ncbi:MAG: hypothetical protein ACTHN5_02120 [Phycisphaerae bacterium]
MGMRAMVLVMGGVVVLGGCQSKNYLTERYDLPRADLKEEPIEVTHQPAPVEVGGMVNENPVGDAPPSAPGVVDEVTGKWTFTTPSTTTRVERKTGEMEQYSIYAGRPGGGDKPMVVITVAPPETESAEGSGSLAEGDPEKYKVTGTRTYTLNGAIAKEWTGRTNEGAAFCELILTRPGGGGDVCHAMAVARSEGQRKEALGILGSIKWTAVGVE